MAYDEMESTIGPGVEFQGFQDMNSVSRCRPAANAS
jgi:hypothetical protein